MRLPVRGQPLIGLGFLRKILSRPLQTPVKIAHLSTLVGVVGKWATTDKRPGGLFVQKKGQQGSVHPHAAVVVDEAHLAKPVHKEAHS